MYELGDVGPALRNRIPRGECADYLDCSFCVVSADMVRVISCWKNHCCSVGYEAHGNSSVLLAIIVGAMTFG